MRGRKPKPTHLHVIEGTLNVTRHRDRADEPRPEGEIVKPKFLKGAASKLWDARSPELIRLQIITSADAETFAMWCCLMAEFQRAPGKMPSNRIGQLRGLAATFGMDPAGRIRLGKREDGPAKNDPAEAYFTR